MHINRIIAHCRERLPSPTKVEVHMQTQVVPSAALPPHLAARQG